MWIKITLFTSLFILGSAYILDDVVDDPKSLELLLDELKDRVVRRPVVRSVLEECEGKPADIAFIIDTSRSIYPPDFKKGIDFLVDFMQIFTISPDHVRVAAVAFGKSMVTDSAFGFNKYDTKVASLQALKGITFRQELGGSTNTGMAIAYARKQFFAYARPTVKKIAIVLTDGKSDYPAKTKAEAELLRSQGVEITAIGVGPSATASELNNIASSPENVFRVNNYGALKNIIRTLGIITCKMVTTVAPTTLPTTTPTTTTTTTTPPPKEEPCNGQAIDFNFVFDPAQMGTSGTEDAIRFIKTVVSAGDLNNGKVRVGTVTGPCPDTKGFRLNRYNNLPNILEHFDTYSRTDMASLITDLRSEAFESKNGGRENARKVGVVFLKGKLSNPDLAMLEAKLAKTKGIEIFIVDTGSLNHESVLESIVSGKTSHILRAADSSEIIEMARSLVAQICKKKSEPDC